MADIQGSYDELFTAVPAVLAGLLDDGDAGGSVAVFVDGEPVVDVWGGFADPGHTVPWERDSITNVWSVTAWRWRMSRIRCANPQATTGDWRSSWPPTTGSRACGHDPAQPPAA
jgi:Beta-lactamase